MLRFNKDKVDVDIDLSSFSRSAIPLLIENEIWIKLFNDVDDKEIVSLKQELGVLVSRSRQVRSKLVIKKNDKKKLISKVLTLSEKVNNNELVEGIDLLDDYKDEIEKINDEIEDLTFQSETIPSEVRSLNLKLLEETIKFGYKDIIEAQENLDEIEVLLVSLRKKLRTTIKEKYDYEEKRNEIYKFLHNTLGPEDVDKLDREILD